MASLDHEKLLRRAIALAAAARRNGNKPFGALLADLEGNTLVEAENTEFTNRDSTNHSEVNLLSKACKIYSMEERARMVMYVSAEPCAMCAGATFFAGVRVVVYGLSGESLAPMWATEDCPDPSLLSMGCREVFESCEAHPTIVIGPMMEDEAIEPHMGFWNDSNAR